MSQRWYEIPDETVALMAEKSDQGQSFSKIGEELSIDRRVVAKAVRHFNDKRSGRATIRSDALIEVWREHLDDMKKAAVVIVELTASPSLRDSLLPSEPDVESRLMAQRPTEFVPQYNVATMGKSLPTESEFKSRVELRLAQRRYEAAIRGLKEHIPVLEDKVKEWQQSAMTYKESWDQLRQKAISIDIPDDQIEPSVKLALKRPPAWGEEEDLSYLRRAATITNGPDNLATILLRRPATKRPMQVFWQARNALEAICKELEVMLSPPQLMKDLVTNRCQYCPVK